MEIANLLLDVTSAEAMGSTGTQSAQVTNEGDPAGSEFQGMILKLLDESEGKSGKAENTEAGQQLPSEKISEKAKSEESSVDSDELLRSTSTSQGLLDAAPDVAIPVAPSPDNDLQVETQPKSEEPVTTSGPANNSPVQVASADDSIKGKVQPKTGQPVAEATAQPVETTDSKPVENTTAKVKNQPNAQQSDEVISEPVTRSDEKPIVQAKADTADVAETSVEKPIAQANGSSAGAERPIAADPSMAQTKNSQSVSETQQTSDFAKASAFAGAMADNTSDKAVTSSVKPEQPVESTQVEEAVQATVQRNMAAQPAEGLQIKDQPVDTKAYYPLVNGRQSHELQNDRQTKRLSVEELLMADAQAKDIQINSLGVEKTHQANGMNAPETASNPQAAVQTANLQNVETEPVQIKKDTEALFTRTAAGKIAPENEAAATVILPQSKTAQEVVVTPKTAEMTSVFLSEAIPAETAENGKNDDMQNRQDQNPAWMTMTETRHQEANTVSGAKRFESPVMGGQPEPVIAAKMIHQIVKSAKVNMIDGGANMTLRLDPPHLGMLQMSVSAQEGMVTAHLQTSTESARQILQADLPQLRQALADAGIKVDSINVSVGGNSDQTWTTNSGQHGWEGTASHGHSRFGRELIEPEFAQAALTAERPLADGRLDYLA